MKFDRNHRIATLVVGSLLALGVTAAQAAIPASERTVLLDLYTSTNGAGWLDSTGWNGAPGTECTWYGVTCNPGQTTVTEIDLELNNLSGALPGNLNNLTGLARFFVGGNVQLTGSIPALTGLTNLTQFYADFSGLNGSIPALTGLTNLQYFDVQGNGLTGSIPALTGLTNLLDFRVNQNGLTGSIPALTGLTNLYNFQAYDNQLTGSIPALSGLTSLSRFKVDGNQLTGSIPTLTGLTNLLDFEAYDNQLTGSIPALTGLTNLGRFFVHNNQLTGSIPALTGLANLSFFYVQNNQLTGSIPALSGLTDLRQFYAFDNQLTGSIPALTGLTNLRIFFVAINQLTGSIPSLSGLTNLTEFLVETNQLTGSIPPLTGLTNLRKFVIHNNQLTGNIPATPIPSALLPGGSRLCPNLLNRTPNTAWDAATGQTPWYANCIAPPGPPTSVSATSGDAAAVVTFTPPASNGGSPITGYTATCGSQSVNGAASPIVVIGLTIGISYTCTVRALNAVGPGPASAPSNSVTLATVPGAPSIGFATPGNARITVPFSPPANNGGSAITGYTATCGYHRASGAATPIVVTGLTNGINYTCTVTATNAQGTGPASAVSNIVMPTVTLPNPTVIVNTVPGSPSATVPGAPIMGVATPRDAGITVPFSPPTSNGGSAITAYTATCGGRSASGAATPIVVTGLTNGIGYTCKVTATNAQGTGPASAVSNSVRPEADTGTRLDTSMNPSLLGNSVTFTATVSGDALTGDVLFRDGAIALAGCAAVPLAGNQAQCIASGLTLGSHPISALYSGDGINARSLSPTLEQVVNPPSLDIDGDGRANALTDGLLIIRYLFGLTGGALTADALGTTAARTDPAAIRTLLDGIRPLLDIDGDGRADALTDGLLIRRYLLGLRGVALTTDVVAPLGTRVTAPAIEAHLESLFR